MLSAFFRKLMKIINSISNEGITRYLKRLYDLGMYRFYVKRLIYRKRMNKSQTNVFGSPLYLPQRIQGIKEELILYGVHEPNATSIYRKLLYPGDVILDIGTNLGYYVCVASDTLGADCQIYGFEPDEELYLLATKNARFFNSSVKLVHCAISDKNGLITFCKSKVSNWGTIMPREGLKLEAKVEVESITIDSFVAENNIKPTVIRMDIEGGETKALKGGMQTLKNIRLLFLEYHKAFISSRENVKILNILEGSGFYRAIWCNRYYDFPWSRPSAQKRFTFQGDINAFKRHCLNENVNVYSLFLHR